MAAQADKPKDEITEAPRKWARALIDCRSNVYRPLIEESREITKAIASHVIGSGRKAAMDNGGHWQIADQIVRGLIRAACDPVTMETLPFVFPLTISAIEKMVGAILSYDLRAAFALAERAANEEWEIHSSPAEAEQMAAKNEQSPAATDQLP